MNHYQDPYKTTSISWKVRPFFLSWLRSEVLQGTVGNAYYIVIPVFGSFLESRLELLFGYLLWVLKSGSLARKRIQRLVDLCRGWNSCFCYRNSVIVDSSNCALNQPGIPWVISWHPQQKGTMVCQ